MKGEKIRQTSLVEDRLGIGVVAAFRLEICRNKIKMVLNGKLVNFLSNKRRHLPFGIFPLAKGNL
jgi:hypothetical protein